MSDEVIVKTAMELLDLPTELLERIVFNLDLIWEQSPVTEEEYPMTVSLEKCQASTIVRSPIGALQCLNRAFYELTQKYFWEQVDYDGWTNERVQESLPMLLEKKHLIKHFWARIWLDPEDTPRMKKADIAKVDLAEREALICKVLLSYLENLESIDLDIGSIGTALLSNSNYFDLITRHCRTLEDLQIGNPCPDRMEISSCDVAAIVRQCPKLQSFSLEKSSLETKDTDRHQLRDAIRTHENLKSLELCLVHSMDETWAKVDWSCKITDLFLADTLSLNAVGLEGLLQKLAPHLVILSITDSPGSGKLLPLHNGKRYTMPNLKWLEVDDLRMSIKWLQRFAGSPIEKLSVGDCPNMKSQELAAFIGEKSLPKLMFVEIVDAMNWGVAGLQKIRKACERVEATIVIEDPETSSNESDEGEDGDGWVDI